MKINIYQINSERDDKRLMFFGLDEIQKLTGDGTVKSEMYDKIFSGEVDCDSMESVYQKFNIDHPDGYTGRSLSVSDVVEVVDSDTTDKGCFFCDNVGFKKIDFEPEKAQDTTKITVLFCQVNQPLKAVTIENSYPAMKKLIGGETEEYMPFEENIALVCNENKGRKQNLPLNRAIYFDNSHDIREIVRGDFFLTYAPLDAPRYSNFPSELEKKFSDLFKYPDRFYEQKGVIKAYPIKPKIRDMER